MEDISGFDHTAIQIADVHRRPEVGFVDIDDGRDDLDGDGFASRGYSDLGIGCIVGKEFECAVFRHKDIGVVSERVVERRLSPWIHDTVRALGAVERVVFGVSRIGQVLKSSCTIEPQLITTCSAVTIVGDHTQLQIDRTEGRGKKTRNGNVNSRVDSATTHCNHGQAVKNRQVTHVG